jgi:hypothetical protein
MIRLQNADDTAHSFRVRIWSDGTRRLTETYDVPANSEVTFALHEQATTVVAVRETSAEQGVVVSNREREWFDCNDSWTYLQLGGDGTFSRGFTTTQMACRTATDSA